jgi:fumarate reductase (CoM/CoB) subunit A
MYQTIVTDVLIIGAGGAGIRAAIEAAQSDVSVLLVAKEVLGKAHTCMAEGGLNVALKEVNPLNSPRVHFRDTIEGGAGLNNQRLVDIFTKEAPQRIRDLEKYGVIFDRGSDGKITQRFSGKQTHPHTVFVGDYTGREIMTALIDQVRRLSVPYLDEHFITKIFAKDAQVSGALAIDINAGNFKLIRSKSIVLCTGGGGRMYEVTSNAVSNSADGYALALDVGCKLVDMEMVQFHPTGMVFPPSARGSLVTESVRGEGGILLNSNEERFMSRYLPERMELGGRDEVARAIYREVQEGRGTARGGVYLDISRLPAAVIEERLPKVLSRFLRVGIDVRDQPMEVYPTMHHLMGGVRINEYGETGIQGLYAAGEVAGGIHGGNRLGGNALTECQVFGRRAVRSAALFSKRTQALVALPERDVRKEVNRALRFLSNRNDQAISPQEIEDRLRSLMWANVGIVRTAEGLQVADHAIRLLIQEASCIRSCLSQRAWNRQWIDCLEVSNMLRVARAITAAALARKESRGAHYRQDYPYQDLEWGERNTVVWEEEGELRLKTIPICTI